MPGFLAPKWEKKRMTSDRSNNWRFGILVEIDMLANEECQDLSDSMWHVACPPMPVRL